MLTEAEQQAFEGFIASGKGYAGVLRVAGAETGWAWYGFRRQAEESVAGVAREESSLLAPPGLPA